MSECKLSLSSVSCACTQRTTTYYYPQVFLSCSLLPSFLVMSRRSQQQASVDTSQPEVPEDELLSATGEGDEVMEEVEEQEGYSACLTPSHYRTVFTPSLPSIHPTDRASRSVTPRLTPASSRRLTNQHRRHLRHP